jgi:L-arabinose isomerase
MDKKLKEVVLAAANIMSDKGYGIGNEPDYLKFKAGRMLLTLTKYRDAGMNTYTYFWKNEEERISSPFFDSEQEAWAWIKEKREFPTDCY